MPSLITLTKSAEAGKCARLIYCYHISKFWSGPIERNSSLEPTMSENTQKYIYIRTFVNINKPNWPSNELSKHHTILIWIYYLYVII